MSASSLFSASSPPLPPRAGAGFKDEHAEAVCEGRPDIGWFEVHPENYMVAGGPRPAALEALRGAYPLSMHVVRPPLRGRARVDRGHLAALRTLVERFQPGLVSEHIAWSARDGVWFADLLPPSLGRAGLDLLCDNIDETHDALGRPILIENPASYLVPPDRGMDEAAFVVEAARRTGCGLLVDVNNVHVSAVNIGLDAEAYVDAIPGDLIGEIHLAGFAVDEAGGERLLIDSHGAAVDDAVWRLYERLIDRVGARPTLIEWDRDIPAWDVLHAEAMKAETRLARLAAPAAA
ncbi:MAG: DUF692 domain-containing protein [Acidobacteria bacterium]|nr:DUF692 domain-containing protein [Acidobacteriota bacterium]